MRGDSIDGDDGEGDSQPTLNVEPVETQSRYGPIKTFGNSDLISRFLATFGEWGQLEVEFLAQFVEANDCIFDVGAFLGTFSLGLHEMAPFGACVAVELNPACHALLCSNLDQNLAVDHHVLNAAVGSREASYLRPDGLSAFLNAENVGSLQLDKPRKSRNRYSEVLLDVPLTGLKAIRRDYGDYDFLKLDIEGAEWDALRTDSVWIRDTHPVLWLECNEDIRSLKLIEFLNWAEYDVHYFAFPSWNPDNYRGTSQSPHPFAFEAGLLGTHGGSPPRLSTELADKGCLLQRISSRNELEEALWLTPRWGLRDWETRSRTQLVALMARMSTGQSRETFLRGQDETDEVGVGMSRSGAVSDTGPAPVSNTKSGRMPRKVFVLGDSRTGTTSLHGLFSSLGLRSIHYYVEEAKLQTPIHESLDSNWEALKHYYLNSEFEAYSDYPTRTFYKQIYELFPDAYFILSLRKTTEAWQGSMTRYFLDRGEEIDLERLTVHYLEINQEIEAFFAEAEDVRFLKVVIDDGSDNGECVKAFLGIDSPATLEHLHASVDPDVESRP